MQVTIELPDSVAAEIRKSSGDIERRVLEAFGVESYRTGGLTGWQLRQLLGFQNRMELDAFLKKAGVCREYSPEELERDFLNSRRASSPAESRP
jgi:hypothetical protein